MYHQQKAEPAIISRLLSVHDKATGNVTVSKPRVITSGQICTVEIKLERTICIETYESVKELGRVTLRMGSNSVAVGKVTSLLN